MNMSRRKALGIVGGGVVLAAGAGTAGFLTTRTPQSARRPWALAGSYEDPRLNALSFGLLAPNPHNLQPWKVALEGADSLTLLHDQNRRLPQTDPFDRQIMIGMGCFLEQMVLAAGAAGYSVDVSLLPEGQEGVARATLRPGGQADPLARHILDRRSCKKPFEATPLPKSAIDDLRGFADIYDAPNDVDALRELTWQAWLTETLTPRTMQESIDLMRMGKAEINATPDGIDMGGAFLESLMAMGVLTREALADSDSTSFKQGVADYRKMLRATPAYAALSTATNTRADHIAAGRKWLRLNLQATAMGLSLHPVSQALQEYPEMAPHLAKAHAMLAPKGHRVQMLGRLGYGPTTPRTPRWPLEAKLSRA